MERRVGLYVYGGLGLVWTNSRIMGVTWIWYLKGMRMIYQTCQKYFSRALREQAGDEKYTNMS